MGFGGKRMTLGLDRTVCLMYLWDISRGSTGSNSSPSSYTAGLSLSVRYSAKSSPCLAACDPHSLLGAGNYGPYFPDQEQRQRRAENGPPQLVKNRGRKRSDAVSLAARQDFTVLHLGNVCGMSDLSLQC